MEDLGTEASAGPARVLVKLETARFGLPSFKVLGASWAVARRVARWLRPSAPDVGDMAALRAALDRHAARPTVLAATDGNHGRAVAWSARQLGCPSEIFVPAGTARSRTDAIAAEGATVHVVDGDYDETVAAAATSAASPDRLLVQDTAVAGHQTGVEDVVAGYATIFDELEAQLPHGAPDPLVLVVPVGVGSLALAAARFLARRVSGGRLVTVEPTEAASLKRSLELGRPVSLPGPHASCMVGLRCGSISADAWPELAAATDLAVAVEDDEADAAMRWLAARGIVVGECGAAALAALRQASADGRITALLDGSGGTAVLIATEAPTDPERWRAVVGREPS
jgi:diaminopropionate ammonia-lyase